MNIFFSGAKQLQLQLHNENDNDKEKKKMNLFFQEPNDCNFNFIQIFDGKTDIEHRQKEFCGSIAEPWTSESDVLYLRSGHIYIFIYMQNLKSKFLYILKN